MGGGAPRSGAAFRRLASNAGKPGIIGRRRDDFGADAQVPNGATQAAQSVHVVGHRPNFLSDQLCVPSLRELPGANAGQAPAVAELDRSETQSAMGPMLEGDWLACRTGSPLVPGACEAEPFGVVLILAGHRVLDGATARPTESRRPWTQTLPGRPG